MRCLYNSPCPEPEGEDSRIAKPPVETINVAAE